MRVVRDQSRPRRDPALRTGLGRLWAQASAWVLAYLPERGKFRRPAVRIHTSASVPGLGLRLVVVLLGLICASVTVTGTPGWVVVIALLATICALPGSLVAGVLVMVLGLLMVFDQEPVAPWRTPLLVAAVPLMMQLAAIAGQATWAARIELRVLGLPLRRYLGIQVFAQLLALTGSTIAGLGFVLPQVMALAAVAVLALVVFWVPSLGPARRRDL
jgi:hypothetical protein